MKRESSFEKNFKRLGKKIIIPLLWFAIVLLLLATIIILTQYTLTKPLNEKFIVVILFILFILYFVWFLFVSVTKYQKETLLDDTEKKAKWESLSPEYKRFYRHLHILGISMSVFMLISGIWLLAIKDPYGWLMLILGANLIVPNIIISRRKNET